MASRLPSCNECDTPDECSTQYINEPARSMDLDSIFKRHLSGAPLGCEDTTEQFDPQGDSEDDWYVMPKVDDICDALEMKADLVRNIRARAIRVNALVQERAIDEQKIAQQSENEQDKQKSIDL